jgi:hypothetical protein
MASPIVSGILRTFHAAPIAHVVETIARTGSAVIFHFVPRPSLAMLCPTLCDEVLTGWACAACRAHAPFPLHRPGSGPLSQQRIGNYLPHFSVKTISICCLPDTKNFSRRYLCVDGRWHHGPHRRGSPHLDVEDSPRAGVQEAVAQSRLFARQPVPNPLRHRDGGLPVVSLNPYGSTDLRQMFVEVGEEKHPVSGHDTRHFCRRFSKMRIATKICPRKTLISMESIRCFIYRARHRF